MNKTNIQTQSSADRITTSLSLAHKNKKTNKQTKKKKQEQQQQQQIKLSTNLTLCEAYTNYWTNHRRAETKMKK